MIKPARYFLIFLAALLLTVGCGKYNRHCQHVGQPFQLKPEQTSLIKDLDKDYIKIVRQKTPVRIQGVIKYQCRIKGAWAFIDDGSSMVFVDFMAPTGNILLPTKQYQNPIIIEGRLVIDDTVLNNYHLIPYAYEYIPQ
jgi:hypothetical protein